MASKPVTLKVQPRGKKIPNLPTETSIYLQGSAGELYQRIAKQSRFSIHRLRITNVSDGKLIPNDPKASIASFGLKDGDSIQAKDLGPQIAWRTVFLIEYAGPLLIHPLFYLLRRSIYSSAPPSASTAQLLSCVTISLHFAKRELETLFVHRFSNATMPAFNIVKNSGHYWLLSGLLMAYTIYSPKALAAKEPANSLLIYPGLALFAFGELANLNTHLILRSLRSPGGTERGVPKGLGFDWVTCPNYLFESVAWAGILMISQSWSTAVFIAVAVGQMAVWAKKKESRYRKELGGKYQKKRYAMLPGLY